MGEPLPGVLSTIYFHNQLACVPNEVRHKWSDRCLPPEMHSERLEGSQDLPQRMFGVGRVTAQNLRLMSRSFRYGAMRHHPTPPPTPPHKGEGRLSTLQIADASRFDFL